VEQHKIKSSPIQQSRINIFGLIHSYNISIHKEMITV